MVILHVKHGNQSQFLFETTVSVVVDELLRSLVSIHNGRLTIDWVCSEFEGLSKHGVSLPPGMQGLTPDQITDLKLHDEWAERYLTSDMYIENIDPIGRRNGKAPVEKMCDVLTKTAAEAKAKISKKLVDANICLTYTDIQDALSILKGALMIVYPMGLPQYEPLQQVFESKELHKEILEEPLTDLWWAGKQLDRGKSLCDYIGKNEKSKLVVKLQKKGHGPPGREPVLTEQQHKMLMLTEYRRQEELKKLDEADDDNYLNSAWADNKKLQKSFQGLSDIRFSFR